MTEIDTSLEAVEGVCRDLMDEPTLSYQEAESMLRALAAERDELNKAYEVRGETLHQASENALILIERAEQAEAELAALKAPKNNQKLLEVFLAAAELNATYKIRDGVCAVVENIRAQHAEEIARLHERVRVSLAKHLIAEVKQEAAEARGAKLRKALNEAVIKVENDQTLWNAEWQPWLLDARAALAETESPSS